MSQVSPEGAGPRVAWACVLALVVGSGLLVPVHRVAACSVAIVEFVIDASLREGDSEAPVPFGALTAFTRRVSATRCEGNKCTHSTCGDHGLLELQFDARDDGTGSDRVGYRVLWLSGELSAQARAALDGVKPLFETQRVTLDVGWSEVPQLTGELALIAVDHAGNESAPSDPVHVEWSGCTSYWDDATCRPTTTNQVSSGAAHGCALASFSAASQPASPGLWLWAAGLAVAGARRRHPRARG
jgi:hypothetical protein